MQYSHSVFALSITISLCVGSTLRADTLSVAWESPTEFSNPESVIFDQANDVLYVSNVNGSPGESDGNGFISKLDLDGNITELKWVEGMDAPKGMAIHDNTLYTADITRLIAIDISNGEIKESFDAEGSQFLNDVAVTAEGTVYVSDMMSNKIYRLSDNQLTLWVEDESLENPNGLLVEGDQLIVGSWGKMAEDFSTEVPGHLKAISLSDAAITSMGSGTPVGNLDGVESDGKGNYLVSDWVTGALYSITPAGESTTLLDLDQGSADIGVVPEKNLVIIPMMNDNKVVSYTIP